MNTAVQSIKIIEQLPDPRAYALLRKAVGWDNLDMALIKAGLSNSLYAISAISGEEIIGCGRVVGYGYIYLYIQDLIVLPEWQGEGIGKRLMQKLMEYIGNVAQQNTFVGLMAAEGISGFYEKFGFKERASGKPGMFLTG